MQKIMLSLALVIGLGATQINAQTFDVGIKGGLNIPNLRSGSKDTPLSEDYSSLFSWGGGAFVEMHLTKTFSMQAGLEYTRQGGNKDGIQALPAAPIYAGATAQNAGFAALTNFMPSDYLYANFKSEPRFDYIMLPVQAKFGWNFSQTSPFRVYVSAGIFGSYLLKAERVSKGSSQFYVDVRKTSLKDYAITNFGVVLDAMPPMQSAMMLGGLEAFGSSVNNLDGTEKITDDIHRFNFGIIGSVGISCKVAPRHSIFIEGGGNYGLINIQKDDMNGQNRIGAASVMIGYAFSL